MHLWTIQPAHVWNLLQNRALLYVDNSQKYRGFIPPAYRWLQSQLIRRLPGYCGHLPWWAYCHRPDLRRHRHLRPKGVTEVRLELEISEERVLRFPGWAWHRVFCADYLATTREEYDDWISELRKAVPNEETWPLPEPWRLRLEASWERLFSAELPLLDWDESSPWSRTVYLEAVFEQLRLKDVRNVTFFKGTFTCGQCEDLSRQCSGRPPCRPAPGQLGQERHCRHEREPWTE